MTLKVKISVNRIVQMHDSRDPNFSKIKSAMEPFLNYHKEMAEKYGLILSSEYGGNKEGLFLVIHDAKSLDVVDLESYNIVEFADLPAVLKNFDRRSNEFLEEFIEEHPQFEEAEFSSTAWRMFTF